METNNEWEIEMLEERYAYLEITREQAQKIYLFENEKRFFSREHFFSMWEEYDYELTSFGEILSEKQFNVFKTERDRQLAHTEIEIAEGDKNVINDIAYKKESLEYLENVFVPDFYKNSYVLQFHAYHERPKVKFLKDEYREFLKETRRKILVEHFRFSRRLQPNRLTVTLLEHRCNYIWPNYQYFKGEMDGPTKAVAQSLEQKVLYFDEIKELRDKKAAESKVFHDKLFKKYQRDTSGWHVVIDQPSQSEQEKNDLMTLLLLDRDKYGLE